MNLLFTTDNWSKYKEQLIVWYPVPTDISYNITPEPQSQETEEEEAEKLLVIITMKEKEAIKYHELEKE